jgi:hypothetical protein
MSIKPEQVLAAFRVTGASPDDVNYTRFTTTELAPLPLIISNSSTAFGIRFYPTASAGLSFKTEKDEVVDINSQVTLPRVSGSNVAGIKLFAVIDTTGFNDGRDLTKEYNIGFDMVAITASNQITEDTTGPNDQPCAPEGDSPILYPCCPGLVSVQEPPNTLLPICRPVTPQPAPTPTGGGVQPPPQENGSEFGRRIQPNIPTLGPADQ